MLPTSPRPESAPSPGSVGPEWVEVRVLAPVEWGELVAERLALGPCTSVLFGAPSLGTRAAPAGEEYVRTFVPVEDDSPALREQIAAAVRELGRLVDDPRLAAAPVSFHPLPREDWATSWKKVWKPFRVGRLAVVPRDFAGELRARDLRLVLEPGGAFGTGRRATTRLCLAALQDHVRGGERVLDAGTGSGVLAVAAALLGARAALGVDLDPRTPVEGARLAAWNGVAERCRFAGLALADLDPAERGFDLALANLYSDLIQAHAADLAARLAPGALAILSGVPRPHVAATRAAVEAAGLAVREERTRGRWWCAVARRA